MTEVEFFRYRKCGLRVMFQLQVDNIQKIVAYQSFEKKIVFFKLENHEKIFYTIFRILF